MTTTIDLEAVKQRQQATWASGDFAEIATLIVPVAERLADAADLGPAPTSSTWRRGSGNVAIAAARLGTRGEGSTTSPPCSSGDGNAPGRSGSRSTSSKGTPRRSRSPTARSTPSSRPTGRCSRPTTAAPRPRSTA